MLTQGDMTLFFFFFVRSVKLLTFISCELKIYNFSFFLGGGGGQEGVNILNVTRAVILQGRQRGTQTQNKKIKNKKQKAPFCFIFSLFSPQFVCFQIIGDADRSP